MDFQRTIPIGKLDGIWNQVQEYLLKTLLVSFDHVTKLLEARETNFNFDIFHFYLFLQDVVYLVDALRDVERCYVFDEVIAVILKDRVIKHVVDEMVDELYTIWHLVHIDLYPLIYEFQFCLNL